MKDAISAPGLPRPIGPYSPAIRSGALLFISGQVAVDPATGAFARGGVEAETRQALENLGALLRAAGLGYDAVVRTTVFLADLEDFAAMNDVYAQYFREPFPARSTVQAARLPRDARVEIDAVASFA